MTRRSYLQRSASVLAAYSLPAIICPRSVFAEDLAATGPTEAEHSAIAQIATQFLERFRAPGLSVAISRDGRIVYQQAFGWADATTRAPLTPAHLFRVASLSKPVTSTCVFTLIEQGKLGLHDLVFGSNGLLGFDYGKNYPANIDNITVYHLLTHTAGGWEKGPGDPMFESPFLNQKELIEQTLATLTLEHTPGEHFGYSNFGYCVLGRVIEKVTGHSYAETVQQNVLSKCGITGMRIGGDTLARRAKSEVVYDSPDAYQMNMNRMDSHGGWIATPSDMVQFALRVDDFDPPPDILRHDTLKTVVTPSAANPGYACGWAVNRAQNWWHNGSLPGLSSIMVRTSTELCWAAFTNTRAEGIDLALDHLIWDMVKAVPAWKA